MANRARGEVSLVLFEDDDNLDTRRFTLKFSNGGIREMEDFLDLERSEIDEKIARGKFGNRLMAALMLGATRKFHRRELPVVQSIDDLMDEIDDEADDPEAEARKVTVALMSAWTGANPSDIEAEILGVEPKGKEKPEEENGAAPKKGRAKAAKKDESVSG